MRPDGVLTTVDTEAEHQRLAKQTFTEAGIATQRVRLIPGPALDVLPRLTDGHYDLVFCDADKKEYPAYLDEALRLLRPGGVVAFDNALWHDRVADPAQRDEETVAIRELGSTVREHDSLVRCCCPSATACSSPRRCGPPPSSSRSATELAKARTGREVEGASPDPREGLVRSLETRSARDTLQGLRRAQPAQQQPGAETGGALGPLEGVLRARRRPRRCRGAPTAGPRRSAGGRAPR